MHINELESIIESAKKEMLEHHEEHEDTDLFLSFLETIAVEYANKKLIYDYKKDNDLLEKYQKLIHSSINEYDITNEKIKTIHSESDIFLKHNAKNEGLIEVESLVKYFNEFQSKVNDELQRANITIEKLKSEVKELESTTNIDPLTLAHNRRGLHNFLDPILEVASANNKQLDMWLIMLDVDDFKIVNDTFGHVAGDKVLIFLAKVLRSIVRKEDHIFRFGGEEFMIILNRITKEKAYQTANRILETIRKNKLIYKSDTINITLSIGLCQHQNGDTIETIVERTDKLLYKAKNSGKNKIEMQGDK